MARIRDLDGNYGEALAPGEQTIRLLGPYTVDFETPNIGGPFPSFALIGDALPIGAVVFSVWAIPYAGWEATPAEAALELYVMFGDRANGNLTTTILGRRVRSGGSSFVENRELGFASMRIHSNDHTAGDPFTTRVGVVQAANIGLSVYVTDEQGNEVTLTAGEADIYALIAESA